MGRKEFMVALHYLYLIRDRVIMFLPDNAEQGFIEDMDRTRLPLWKMNKKQLYEWFNEKDKNERMKDLKTYILKGDLSKQEDIKKKLSIFEGKMEKELKFSTLRIESIKKQIWKYNDMVRPFGTEFIRGQTPADIFDENDKIKDNCAKYITDYEKSIDDAVKEIKKLFEAGHKEEIKENEWNNMLNHWAKMHSKLRGNNNYIHDTKIHRFSNIYPYEFNSMDMYIGSWMDRTFGLMQWPVAELEYMLLLRNIIKEKNVVMIVAIGQKNAKERLVMKDYWKDDLGQGDFQAKENNNVNGYKLWDIKDGENTIFKMLYFENWTDFEAPSADQLDIFQEIFQKINDNLEKTDDKQKIEKTDDKQKIEKTDYKQKKRVLIHCRAGVGRSGTFRLMYKYWEKFKNKGEVKAYDLHELIADVTKQRALRAHTVQARGQFNYLKKYIESLHEKS